MMLLWKMNSFTATFKKMQEEKITAVLRLGFECKTCLKNVKNLKSISVLFKNFEMRIGNIFSSKVINK